MGNAETWQRRHVILEWGRDEPERNGERESERRKGEAAIADAKLPKEGGGEREKERRRKRKGLRFHKITVGRRRAAEPTARSVRWAINNVN